MSLPCLILGGGLGTRMRPDTDTTPKPLLRVGGEPFVAHQLRWLATEGVTDVIYSIGYRGDMIRAELAGRADLDCRVRFADEGDRRLGTGGAVRFAVDDQGLDGAFFVLYGDSYLQIALGSVLAAWNGSGAEALMTVYRNEDQWDASNARFDGRFVARYDKTERDPAGSGMRHIDYGLSILQAETVRARIPASGPSDLAVLFNELSIEGQLAGYEAQHRFFEIGSPAGLVDLEQHLASLPWTP